MVFFTACWLVEKLRASLPVAPYLALAALLLWGGGALRDRRGARLRGDRSNHASTKTSPSRIA